MVLNKQERKYKRFLALQRESNAIYEAKRKLPWTEVKPYQDGWFIHIEFKDEVKRRTDYPHLLTVLNLVHRRGRTKDPKMVNRLRHTKRLDNAYKLFPIDRWNQRDYSYKDSALCLSNWYYSSTPPHLGRIRPEDYDKLSPNEKKWFMKFDDGKKSYFHVYGEVYYRAQLPDGWLRMKVRPAYVTHVKEIDPLMMQREAEIDKELDFLGLDFYTNYYHHYSKHYENRARRAHDRASLRAIIKGEKEDFEHLRKNINYD